MVTRFAPSLTGYLHLGHVLHMLYVWGIAQKMGARVLCRIEDHDLSRARPEYETAIFQTLEGLGFFPDLGMGVLSGGSGSTPTCPFLPVARVEPRPPLIGSGFRQSECGAFYQKVLDRLEERGLIYGCECSRKEISARQPPGSDELHYSGTCADKGLPLEGNTVRFRTLEGETIFQDLELGEQCQNPRHQCGDFSLRDRNGQWTYQFACVCDDIRHGVDLVIRGEDILFSTARQIQLFQTLEAPIPQYYHHPLLSDESGKKLSKRQRSESITQLREAGASPEEINGRAAFLGNLIPKERSLSLQQALSLVGKRV